MEGIEPKVVVMINPSDNQTDSLPSVALNDYGAASVGNFEGFVEGKRTASMVSAELLR